MTGKILKLLLAVTVIAVTAYFGNQYLKERRLTQIENEATEAFNEQKYRTAIERYENLLQMLPDKNSERGQRVQHQLALCFKNLAEDPSLPTFRTIELQQKASAYDRSVVPELIVDRLLDQGDIALPGQ